MRQDSQMFSQLRVPLALVAINVAFGAVFLTVTLSAFHKPTPHGVPVGIVAPAGGAQRLRSALERNALGGFALRSYPSEARAKTGIADRQVDGAVVAGTDATRVLIARAGGSAPAQLLTTAATALAVHTGKRVAVVDAVPPPADDSQALSPYFMILCVLFPSVATGSATAHLFRRRRAIWRIGVPVVTAAAVGLAAAGVADAVTGAGDYLSSAGIIALFSLAIAAPTAALGRIKLPLIGLAVLTFLVLGIPASGGPSNLTAFTPGFLRALHSVLPLGVATDALRNTVYFHGNDTAGHLWVLGAWAAAGIAALLLHPVRTWLTPALSHYGLRLGDGHARGATGATGASPAGRRPRGPGRPAPRAPAHRTGTRAPRRRAAP
jgi:hypothetical protein